MNKMIAASSSAARLSSNTCEGRIRQKDSKNMRLTQPGQLATPSGKMLSGAR